MPVASNLLIKTPDFEKYMNDNNYAQNRNTQQKHSLYLDETLYNEKLQDIITENFKCLPQTTVHNTTQVIDSFFIEFTLNNCFLNIPAVSQDYILRCLSNKEIVIVPVFINFTSVKVEQIVNNSFKLLNWRHANILIITPKGTNGLTNDLIEYFEPYGNVDPKLKYSQKLLINKIKELWNSSSKYDLSNADYDYFNESGLQVKDSLCALWCLYIVYHKILNPDKKLSDIQKYLKTLTGIKTRTSDTQNSLIPSNLFTNILDFIYILEEEYKTKNVNRVIYLPQLFNTTYFEKSTPLSISLEYDITVGINQYIILLQNGDEQRANNLLDELLNYRFFNQKENNNNFLNMFTTKISQLISEKHNLENTNKQLVSEKHNLEILNKQLELEKQKLEYKNKLYKSYNDFTKINNI